MGAPNGSTKVLMVEGGAGAIWDLEFGSCCFVVLFLRTETTNSHEGTRKRKSHEIKNSPPSEGGVAAASADGVGSSEKLKVKS